MPPSPQALWPGRSTMPARDDNAAMPPLTPEFPPEGSAEETRILRKVTLRLIPFLFLLYIINILDRTNIGIAKLRLLDDLKLDDAAYGVGAGLFYLGYVVFEVPSNL